MSDKKPGRLPTLDITQPGHSVSTVIIAVTGMVNGNYGDFKTGDRYRGRDFVHVTREADGSYLAVYKPERRVFRTEDTLKLAQFIMNRVR